MATYVVGDLQGCLTPLLCLMQDVKFSFEHDQLWLAGDLVNRGPESLQTLRYIKDLDQHYNCVKIVLGNHDLHLLACALSTQTCKPSDTLDDILQADDCDELIDWLRRQPLAINDEKHLMVHAGICPSWSITQTLELAKEVENVLQGQEYQPFFEQMYGNQPDLWQPELQGLDRLRCITNYLTRLRYCKKDGQQDFKHKLSPTQLPGDSLLQPWFELLTEQTNSHHIIFGHWASLLGECPIDKVHALDTGCVWGGKMRMLRLEDKAIFECDCKHE